MKDRRIFIAGGAGFIGSHFADRLLADPQTECVTLFDNHSSGRKWHYAHHLDDERLSVVKADIKDLEALAAALVHHDLVIHLASNPDIARAATTPEIDFFEGTFLTHQILEAMRRSGVPRILYASGSGVYGDIGEVEADEDFGPLIPISTYGASKLAGEAIISAYCHMFDMSGLAFRFGNVVGPRQTHGVGFDFVRKLLEDPTRLKILGDGTQSKSYIHVSDVLEAVLLANDKSRAVFKIFNVATGDYITVKEIADIAVQCLGIPMEDVTCEFSEGNRGWKGDVPVIRIKTDRIKALGWKCSMGSREALRKSILAVLDDARTGKL